MSRTQSLTNKKSEKQHLAIPTDLSVVRTKFKKNVIPFLRDSKEILLSKTVKEIFARYYPGSRYNQQNLPSSVFFACKISFLHF